MGTTSPILPPGQTASALRVRDAVAEQLADDLADAHERIAALTEDNAHLRSVNRVLHELAVAGFDALRVVTRERDLARDDRRRLSDELADVYRQLMLGERVQVASSRHLPSRVTGNRSTEGASCH